jgi:hypothetical protein
MRILTDIATGVVELISIVAFLTVVVGWLAGVAGQF